MEPVADLGGRQILWLGLLAQGVAGKSTVVKNHSDDVSRIPLSRVTRVAPITGSPQLGRRSERQSQQLA